ncbi:protein DMP7-like [Canna indica]|uniref:Protein DMP7-like n=1 Tax=Canna indica TaxID=4628 RepID=A0AAQ3JS69_9LILI|nr:protein DMP7-like [Canna indica]
MTTLAAPTSPTSSTSSTSSSTAPPASTSSSPPPPSSPSPSSRRSSPTTCRCSRLNRWLIAASCVFFTFTDSFRAAASGRLYYGVATPRGIWTFNARCRGPPDPAAYRLTWSDLFHALLSLAAFLTFAGLHGDVMECYYVKLPRKMTNTAPLVVGFVVSVLFVVFPSKRKGIVYPFLLQRDAVFLKQ